MLLPTDLNREALRLQVQERQHDCYSENHLSALHYQSGLACHSCEGESAMGRYRWQKLNRSGSLYSTHPLFLLTNQNQRENCLLTTIQSCNQVMYTESNL